MIVLFLMLLLPQDQSAEPEKIAELIRQLGDDAQETREAAMKDLTAVGTPAIPFLEEAKTDDDAEIRLRAEKLLKIIPLRARLAFSGELLKEYPNLYDDLAQCGTAGDILAILKSIRSIKDGKQVYHASDKDIALLMREALRNDRAGLTNEGKMELCRIAGGAFGWTEHTEKVFILGAGGVVGEARVSTSEWVKNSDPVIDAVPELVSLANDEDSDVRREAIHTIETIGLKKASPALRTMLADEDKETRKRAVAVLRGLNVSEGEIDRMTQGAIDGAPDKEEPKKE